MCELVAEEGLSLDVASGGELYTARLAGVPPERIYFHGNNKSPAEIEAGLDAGIGFFVVDSLHEIELLSAAARRRGVRQRVLVRLTPGVRPTRTATCRPARPTASSASVWPTGLPTRPCAACSPLPPTSSSSACTPTSARRSSTCRRTAARSRCCSPPSPTGVASTASTVACSTSAAASASATPSRTGPRRSPSSPRPWSARARASAERYGCPLPRLLVEPGRSIAGKAAVTAYTHRHHQGDPRRAHVRRHRRRHERQPAAHALRLEVRGHAGRQGRDAGHAGRDRGRQALRDERRAGARRGHRRRPRSATCWSRPAPAPTATSMANNYNMVPRPAVVLVAGGRARLIVERETWEDVARLQRPLR